MIIKIIEVIIISGIPLLFVSLRREHPLFQRVDNLITPWSMFKISGPMGGLSIKAFDRYLMKKWVSCHYPHLPKGFDLKGTSKL
jgi:hypothetical protein